jgi:hypothetical protein
MIEKIHKYSGLLMAVLVISAFAFIFGDFSRGGGSSSGQAVMKIAGRTYDDKEFRNLGQGGVELAQAIGSGDYAIYQFLMALTSGSGGGSDPVENFFTGRMLIREAKATFGVYPGEEEISNYLRGLRLFTGADGQFSAETYRRFIEQGMGQLGMTEKDLRSFASDYLAFNKINEILGAGLNVDRATVIANLSLDKQQITGELAKLELAPFQEKMDPTEEEIKAYWETIQDSFTTEAKRKFTYFIATPEPITDAAEPEVAEETLAEAAASDEARKAAAAKREAERAKRAAEAAEARRANQTTLDKKVGDFLDNLLNQHGAGFEELAKSNQWELKTTELFSSNEPPADLSINLRGSSIGGTVVQQLFAIVETQDALSKFSPAIAVGENQWLIARLDDEEKSRPKTFEEARNEARAQYISEKAVEALTTATNEAIAKIKESMAAGKTFSEAAKEAGIAETSEFSNITRASRPDGATQPTTLFQASSTLDPGAVAEPIIESDRAFILHVTKRELVKDPEAETLIDSEVKARTTENQIRAFSAWLAEQTEKAKVEALYKR